MRKLHISLRLPILLMLAMLWSIVAVAYDFEVDGIYYNINGNEATVTYQGEEIGSGAYYGNVVIPETITYNNTSFQVTAIGDYAFYCIEGSEGLTSITIPNSVTSIGEGAFALCTGLTNIILPSNITSIEGYAFYECSALMSVSIPSSVTSIGYYAFYECSSLTSVSIPRSVTEIGESAFMGCSALTSIGLPSSIISIGDYAFVNCNSLTTVYSFINPENVSMNEFAFYIDGYSYNTDYSFRTLYVLPGYSNSYLQDIWRWSLYFNSNIVEMNPVKVEGIYYKFINDNEVAVTSGNEYYTGEVNIPEMIDLGGLTFSVSAIERYAFSYSNLTSVVIPKSVTSIGYGAFLDCNDLNVVYSQIFDPSVISMSNSVFYASMNYDDRTLYVPEGSLEAYQNDEKWSEFFGSIIEYEYHIVDFEVDGIYYIFNHDGDYTVSVTYKGDDYYDYYNHSDRYTGHVEIPATVSYEGITYTVTAIGHHAFFLCEDLTSVTIPNTVTSIERCAFSDCKGLSNVSIGNSVTTIGEEAFQCCYRLKSIEIPNSVTYIGPEAIAYCHNLESVVIGISLTEIGSDAFYGNYALTSVKVLAVNPPSLVNDRTFYGCYNTATLEVPESAVDAYRNHEHWGRFQSIQPIAVVAGDVDGDGSITIGDVANLIDMLLRGGASIDDHAGADVDVDGAITIADVSAIIDMLLRH